VELRSGAAPDPRWLVLGLASTVAAYWMFQQASAGPVGEAESAVPPLGFAASAGFGMLLGMRHALEPDHLAAVSTLMTGERSSASAAWLGACWGLGHTLTLLMAGALLVVVGAEMPAIAARIFELGVVLLLVGFGVRAIYQGARRVPIGPRHTHRTPRAFLDRWTLARPLLVGAVHGLAGSGAMTALVVTALPSTATQLGYLTLFGIGSIVGMAVLSGLLGWPIARLGTHHVFTRTMSIAVGCVSTALGLVWGYPLVERLF
jgi:high-affinity nickel-transport protein